MSNSIEKAEQRLNKGEQVKEDMALMLAPHANLIQQVVPTKLSIRNLYLEMIQIHVHVCC